MNETQQQVVALMESSRNSKEWNANADEVKRQCGGYPGFWYSAIIGLAHRVQQSWLETAVALPQSLRKNPQVLDNVAIFSLSPPTPEEIAKMGK